MRDLQQTRRINPYPWSWEVPVAAVTTVLLVMTFTAHTARAVANMIAGAGFTLTPREALLSAVPGLVRGDAAAGLSPAPSGVADPVLLWSTTAVTELAVLVAVVWAAVRAMRRWGPARVRGTAEPADVEQLLGVSRLRRNAPVIRPDLYGPRRVGVGVGVGADCPGSRPETSP